MFVLVYGWSQTSNMKKNIDSTMQQLTMRAATQFEGLLDDMSNISLGIAGSPHVHEQIRGTFLEDSERNYFQSNPEAKKQIQSVMCTLCGPGYANKSLNVISKNYDFLTLNIYDSKEYTKDEIRNVSGIKYVLENDLDKYISPVNTDEYGRAPGKTFSFIRPIQNEYQHLGVVDVQYEEKFLEDIFTVTLTEGEMDVIVLQKGVLFYQTQGNTLVLSDAVPKLESTFAMHEEGALENVVIGGEEYRICRVKIEPYEMDIYAIVKAADYMEPVWDSLAVIILFGIMILSGMLALSLLISYSLYKPIRQLRDTIEDVDYTSLSFDMQIQSNNNEIILLTEAFDKMFEGIKHTQDELVESRIREIKANYQVLQEQINPHFIHNILAVIGLMGCKKNAPEIMEICSELTRMLRYSTGTVRPIVAISEEEEHVLMYLKLMKYRYLDQLEYSVNIETPLREVKIPKFVLQPLVENCFQHSFKDRENGGFYIKVWGEMTSKGWIIFIEDNGDGFTQKATKELEQSFYEIRERLKQGETIPDSQIGGMALINTYARLYLYSNGQMRIQIEKSDLGGACVSVRWSREKE